MKCRFLGLVPSQGRNEAFMAGWNQPVWKLKGQNVKLNISFANIDSRDTSN